MQDVWAGAVAAPRMRAGRAVVAGDDPAFAQALRATAGAFARHPLHITLWAFVCFAGAGVIGSLLYAVMILDAVARTGTHSGITQAAYNTQMLVQATLGAFAWQIGRGAITWVALQAPGAPVTLGATLRAVLRNGWPLLASAALYGALITIGLLGLMLLLRELRLDVSNARWARGSIDSVMHWTTVRALASLPPDPGAPFGEWLAALRYNLARAAATQTYFGFDLNAYVGRAPTAATLAVGLAALALLVIADAMLCMRTAAIFAKGGGANWLREALDASASHFLRVVGWRWAIRLAVAGVAITTLILLPAFHQAMVMDAVRSAISAGGYWPYHIAQSAYGVGIALVSSLLVAFSVVFEARMFMALRASPLQSPLQSPAQRSASAGDHRLSDRDPG